jgi:hypothetical protein
LVATAPQLEAQGNFLRLLPAKPRMILWNGSLNPRHPRPVEPQLRILS